MRTDSSSLFFFFWRENCPICCEEEVVYPAIRFPFFLQRKTRELQIGCPYPKQTFHFVFVVPKTNFKLHIVTPMTLISLNFFSGVNEKAPLLFHPLFHKLFEIQRMSCYIRR